MMKLHEPGFSGIPTPPSLDVPAEQKLDNDFIMAGHTKSSSPMMFTILASKICRVDYDESLLQLTKTTHRDDEMFTFNIKLLPTFINNSRMLGSSK